MKKYLIVMLAHVSSLAFASTQGAPAPKEDPEVPIEVHEEIPQSEIQFESVGKQQKSEGRSRWGFALSTWAPEGLKIGSYLNGQSEFKRTVLPEFSLENLSRLGHGHHVLWDLRLGLSYLMMERSGALPGPFSSTAGNQKLHLMTAMLGVEASLSRLDSKSLRPYLQMNLRPALALSTRSVFEEGSANGGFIFEGKIGSEIRLGAYSQKDSQYYLNLAAGAARVALLGSQQTDLLAEAGLRAAF